MTEKESAIAEEIEDDGIDDSQAEDVQEESVEDQYNIEEPEDDEEMTGQVMDDTDVDNKSATDNDKKEPEPKKDTGKDKTKDADSKETESKKDTDEDLEDADSEKDKSVSDELAAKAKKLGISDEDIALFDKPEQLEKLCKAYENSKDAEQEQKEEKQEQSGQDNSDSFDEEFKLDLDPDLYDPDICKAMQSTAKQINGIKGALSSVVSAVRSQSNQSFEREFESMISGLGDSFADTLGKGSINEIGTDSQFYTNRCKLIEEMTTLAAGYAQTNKPLPESKVLFNKAINSVFGDKVKANVTKDIASQLDKRASQFINRPVGSKGKSTMTPTKRAATAVAEKLREFGAYNETEIEEDF